MKISRGSYIGFFVICLSVLAVASEHRIKMADLPSAVRTAALEQSKGSQLRGVSKEVENGKTFYEIETVVNRHGRNIELDSSGRVLEVEEEVTLAGIPEAARIAIQSAAEVEKY